MATSRTGTGSWKRIAQKVRATALDQGLTKCPRCKVQLDWEYSRRPNSAEVDHVIAHALGGQDSIENSRILCRRCNQQLGGQVKQEQARRTPKPVMQTVELDASPIW